MNYSTYRFTLDIHQTRSQVSIPVFYQDTWVKFLINLTDGGKPYTLEGVEKVILYAKKKDGTTLTEECDIIDNYTRIEYPFSEQTASAIGPVECEFRLYSKEGGKHITTPSFIILVEERVVEDEYLIPSISNPSAIDKMIDTEAARVEAETERIANEASRVSAEAERVKAETERVEAESKRQNLADTIDEKIAGKLDVPTGANHLWATDQNGNLVYHSWSQSAAGKTFVRRTPNGQVKTKEAIADDDAVPLAQMNVALATKAESVDLSDLVSRVDELEKNSGGSNKIYTVDSTPAYMKKVPANVAQYAEVRKVGAISEEVINCFSAAALINECDYPSDTEWADIAYSGSQEEGYEFHCYPHSLYASYTTAKTLRELFPYAKAGVPYILAYDTSELPEDDDYYTYYGGSLDLPCASRYQYGTLCVFTDAELDNGHMNISGGSFSFHDYEMDQYMDEPVEETFSNIRLVKYGYDIGDKTVTPVTAVVSYGKNLFNCLSEEVSGDATITDRTESTITVTATSKGKNVLIPIPFRIPDGTKVSISGSWTTTGKARGSIQLVWAYSSSTSSCFTLSVSGGTKTGAAIGSSSYDGCFALCLGTNYATTPDVGDSVTFNNIQVEIGDATSWSPFMSETIAFPAEVQALPAYGRGADEEHFNHIAWDENGKATYVQMVDENLNVLPTPVITDISHLITDDNLIQVESGGRMVFVNKYLDSAQNTIYYEMKA